jgi:molecular chaperone DnaJ
VGSAVRDYYEVLGVARDADGLAIKRAFRASARRLHPDVSNDPDADRKFRELADAYAVLSKPAGRLLYDRFGYRGGGAWVASPAAAQAFYGLLDFLGRTKHPRRARTDVAEIELEFYEAARGGRRRVSYLSSRSCAGCGGSGVLGGGPATSCPACGGRGHIRERDEAGGVRLLQLVTCGECGGSGQLVEALCPECGGAGETEETRTAVVTIPSGVEDGARLPLEADRDGPRAVVRIRSEPPDAAALRLAAALGLAVAVAFLLFLLLR